MSVLTQEQQRKIKIQDKARKAEARAALKADKLKRLYHNQAPMMRITSTPKPKRRDLRLRQRQRQKKIEASPDNDILLSIGDKTFPVQSLTIDKTSEKKEPPGEDIITGKASFEGSFTQPSKKEDRGTLQ